MKKILSLLLLCCLMSSTAMAAENSTLAKAKERGVLRVGFSSFVPWAMQNKGGEFVGFEIDVATRLAKDLGLRLQLTPTAWAGIIPALLAGKFDVIIGGMGITPERSEQVSFSEPYDFTELELLTNKSKGAALKTLEDFNKPEVTIITRTGATAALQAKKIFPKASIRQFADEAPCVEEVLSGRAHAFLTTAPLGAFSVADNPEKVFLPVQITEYKEPIGMAVKKGDTATLKELNQWIKDRHADGWLKEREAYWFKNKNWEKDL